MAVPAQSSFKGISVSYESIKLHLAQSGREGSRAMELFFKKSKDKIMRLLINTLIPFFAMVELHLPNPIKPRHGHVTGYGK